MAKMSFLEVGGVSCEDAMDAEGKDDVRVVAPIAFSASLRVKLLISHSVILRNWGRALSRCPEMIADSSATIIGCVDDPRLLILGHSAKHHRE